MSFTELFKGIAVVIDDEIKDKKATIWNLVNQFNEEHIPHTENENHPTISDIEHWNDISFILLDWKLRIGSAELSEYEIIENIDFLILAKENCFAPIFIFTNQSVSEVEHILIENNLYFEDQNNIIFIKSKRDLKNPGKLFSEIKSGRVGKESVKDRGVVGAFKGSAPQAKSLLTQTWFVSRERQNVANQLREKLDKTEKLMVLVRNFNRPANDQQPQAPNQ